MTLNGFVSGFILVLLFVLQIHSKSAPSLRQKRAPQLVDFPRAARAAWHYPRMGRSWSPQNNDASSLSDLCCPKGPKDVMTLELFDEPRAFCRAEKCCKGLTEVTRFSEDRSIVFSLCLPDDIALIQDGTQES